MNQDAWATLQIRFHSLIKVFAAVQELTPAGLIIAFSKLRLFEPPTYRNQQAHSHPNAAFIVILRKMVSSSMSPKRKLDILFMLHSGVAVLCGALAFVFPALFEHFMIVHEYEVPDVAHPGGEVKITHTVIRIYGM